MTTEVHTENGVEGHGTPRSSEAWKLRVAWLLMFAFLLGVVLLFVWVGSVGASAAGGCGGG